MDGWIWCAAAFTVFAALVRSCTTGTGRNWGNRAVLLSMSIAICLMLHFAIIDAPLYAAEAAMATGRPVQVSAAVWMARHYDPVLLPVYAGLLAVLIDISARVFALASCSSKLDTARVPQLWRSLFANLLLFVGGPSVVYVAAVALTDSSSIIDDAGGAAVMPVVATYGAPAYWLNECLGACRSEPVKRAARWPWNPGYIADPRISRRDFLRDAAPWITLSVLLACAAALFRPDPTRRFGAYFIAPDHRDVMRGPWRGRVGVVFLCVAALPVAAALSLVWFVATLPYLLLTLLTAGIVAVIYFLCRAGSRKM
jgi:hypothetical protein